MPKICPDCKHTDWNNTGKCYCTEGSDWDGAIRHTCQKEKPRDLMKTIWKYQLEMAVEQTLKIPEGARFLHLETQRDVPCLWLEVEPENTLFDCEIIIVGTGHDLPKYHGNYIGTFVTAGGTFVFHCYFKSQSWRIKNEGRILGG